VTGEIACFRSPRNWVCIMLSQQLQFNFFRALKKLTRSLSLSRSVTINCYDTEYVFKLIFLFVSLFIKNFHIVGPFSATLSVLNCLYVGCELMWKWIKCHNPNCYWTCFHHKLRGFFQLAYTKKKKKTKTRITFSDEIWMKNWISNEVFNGGILLLFELCEGYVCKC
jgi:hypothetical protein